MAMDTSGGRGTEPLGGGQRDPYSAAYYSPTGGQKPVWTGGRAGNPMQFQADLRQWKRAQGLMQQPAPVQSPGLKWSPLTYGPRTLTAGSGYGLLPYSFQTIPFQYFAKKAP